MAREYLYSAVVNQKLAFARVELAAAVARDGDTIDAKLARHAHLDSAIGQLCAALTYFVAEIGEQYDVTLDPSQQNLSAVLAEFNSRGRQSAEIAELAALRKKPGSWLTELLQARSNPVYLAQRFGPGGEEKQENAGVIPVVDVTQESEQDPLGLVQVWARSAQSQVDRLRASLHEE